MGSYVKRDDVVDTAKLQAAAVAACAELKADADAEADGNSLDDEAMA